MAKLFQTPEYIKKVIDEIVNSPEIIKAIGDAKLSMVKIEGKIVTDEDDQKIMFKLWLIDQYERFNKVRSAVESYMNAQGKILPAESTDFMRWFVKVAKQADDYLSVKIQDYHFVQYHEERLRKMKEPSKWDGLYNELESAGYIKSSPIVFNYVMENKHLSSGSDKIQWLTSKVDALDFQTNFGFTLPQLNKCFYHPKTGTPFTVGIKSGSKPLGYRNEELASIIEKYRPINSK